MPPEPPPGVVVSWQTWLSANGLYTFCAVHVAGRGWYVTGQWTAPITWAEVLSLARGSPVYAATHWTPL